MISESLNLLKIHITKIFEMVRENKLHQNDYLNAVF